MEAFLHGGGQQTLPHYVLRGIFRKLQVVNTRVDRRVTGVRGVHLPDDGEARVQVGEATGGQRGATSGELQERFPLVRRHSTENSDETQEARTVSGVAQLWFSVVDDVISGPGR